MRIWLRGKVNPAAVSYGLVAPLMLYQDARLPPPSKLKQMSLVTNKYIELNNIFKTNKQAKGGCRTTLMAYADV